MNPHKPVWRQLFFHTFQAQPCHYRIAVNQMNFNSLVNIAIFADFKFIIQLRYKSNPLFAYYQMVF